MVSVLPGDIIKLAELFSVSFRIVILELITTVPLFITTCEFESGIVPQLQFVGSSQALPENPVQIFLNSNTKVLLVEKVPELKYPDKHLNL